MALFNMGVHLPLLFVCLFLSITKVLEKQIAWCQKHYVYILTLIYLANCDLRKNSGGKP